MPKVVQVLTGWVSHLFVYLQSFVVAIFKVVSDFLESFEYFRFEQSVVTH